MAEKKRSPLVDPGDMVWNKWYLVEVSFRDTNPIHRAIATDYRAGRFVTLIASYEDWIVKANLDQLAYFRVLEPIKGMRHIPLRMPADEVKP